MTNLTADLRLLSNRKALALNSLTNLKEYELRSAQIQIEWKFQVIIEALEGLHALNIHHSCNLSDLVDNFEAIAPSMR